MPWLDEAILDDLIGPPRNPRRDRLYEHSHMHSLKESKRTRLF